MVIAAEIYDRKSIMEVVERDCLGDPGASGVIVGAQKAGKTAVLCQVSKLGSGRTESLFCRVEIDDLEVFEYTDNSFLRLFLEDLQKAVVENLASLEPKESGWRTDLATIQGGAATANMGQAAAIRGSLDELAGLRQVNGLIGKLLDSTEPIEPADTHRIFSLLPRISKRVVLVIDEFHRMMRQPKFTNKLFAFLRGASTQGKILTMVSSPVHLMDPSLHGPELETQYDRLNLFNHYQTQFLEPFSRDEALGFLDWLGPVTPPLEISEREYICEMGGGSPHFLKKARELFIKHHPNTPEKRAEFERIVAFAHFEPDFQLLWGRCSTDERTVLSEIALAGNSAHPLADKLEREGYVMKGIARSRLFSTLFQSFVQRQSSSLPKRNLIRSAWTPPPRDAISAGPVELLSKAFATAIGLACSEEARIFKVEVTNSTKVETRVVVRCHVMRYSQITERVFQVSPGKQWLYGSAVFNPESLHRLENAVPGNVNYGISYGPAGSETRIDKGQLPIQLLPPNNFPMAIWDPGAQAHLNQTWLIAAWVRRKGSKLQELLVQAGELTGYQVPEGTDPAEHTRKQITALYDAIKKRKLVYQNSAQVYLSTEKQLTQQVRLPEQTLIDGAANCLDTAVLFASLMVSCQIDPVILFLPGHAVVGWRDGAGGMEFLQTTGLAERTFDEAREEGNHLYIERKDECDACLRTFVTHIKDPDKFAILVDVMETSKKHGLTRI